MIDERIKEECGVFGIYSPSGDNVASSIYYGLSALQHRGQESCGIAVCDTNGPKGNMNVHKGMGLVNEVFKKTELDALAGNLGVGHLLQAIRQSVTLNPSYLIISKEHSPWHITAIWLTQSS